jgi:hypothetical protein
LKEAEILKRKLFEDRVSSKKLQEDKLEALKSEFQDNTIKMTITHNQKLSELKDQLESMQLDNKELQDELDALTSA